MRKIDAESVAVTVFAEPVVRAVCAGTAIRSYGYTWVPAQSPDLTDETILQVGNAAPLRKAPLKTSMAISSNRVGVNSSRMPHSPAVDDLPLEAIHLIDGDEQTCWCSRSQPTAAAAPAWIRLDLPLERPIARIVLRKRPAGAPRNQPGSMPLDDGAVEVGMAMPAELEIAISRDGQSWETVFHGASDDTPEKREFSFDLGGTRAKQILITGRHLARVENWLFSFSIGAVDVYDAQGRNVALVTRGTSVVVSSTQHCFGQTIEAHRWLWPLQADLGVKWVRVGYHDDPINWHRVERERGVLAVDVEADAAISWLHTHGIDTVMALGFGNRLYTQDDPARHLPQLWEWYYENPAPPTTPEALEAWGCYVRFMVRHFRDRVRYFEIWNEWNCDLYFGGPVSVEAYLAIARVAIPIIREECPEAKIGLGGIAGFAWGMSHWTPEQLAEQEGGWLGSIPPLAREVDVIGWHPIYQTNPEAPHMAVYPADVRALQAYCRAHGFRGEFMASEWNYGASYPAPTPPNWWGDFVCSEMEKAKYVARLTVLHTALAVTSIFCEQWNSYYPLDLTLMRRTVAADPISPEQPQAAYYVMRNLATALEGLEPAEFAFTLDGAPESCRAFTLARPGARVLALWQDGLARDHCAGVPCDIVLDRPPRSVTAYDPMNGTEQSLICTPDGAGARIPGVLIRDYPVLLYLAE